ncbi:DUF185-domain-containing protein [Sporormia fimetaria CBS 119925]|uniref:Protein arginine methyltransferase NDUFAF7 n=1 Tax=Sporormia fimetaria CBS 119925 TaxID=1340428 RepID=A0A6A6VDU7_9PLEO|nr:DUF185-domain-containing protein [Sporormia fimetaria CBS 119925]
MRAHSLTLCRNAARTVGPRRTIIHRGAQNGIRWSSSDRQWSTPLAKSLAEAITTTGPISVAAYMRQCLTSPEGGYYTRHTSGRDQFGAKGDFITSPEISQVFGELVGIWLYTEWLAQGQKDKVQLIEVGPGRGTLMDDVLRAISSFKGFAQSIEAIYMIEASPHLRKQQSQLLCGNEDLKETEFGWSNTCKYLPGCDVIWCEDIRFVPKEQTSTPFILAHEFFDALPIHVFQSRANSTIPASSTIMTPTGPIKPKHGPLTPQHQWHELVVSPLPLPPSTSSTDAENPPAEFHLTVSKHPTPHSLYLPNLSQRYKALSKTDDAIIEISPESLAYITDFATRIGGPNPPSSPPTSSPSTPSTPQAGPIFTKPTPSGCALILDYGPSSTIPANTLRGIRSHKLVSPFSAPGTVDLSADVDFMALAETAIISSPGVEVHGPVEQAFFLESLGIGERVRRLVEQGKMKGEGKEVLEKVERMESSWKRLVDRGPTGMGRIYKALAIVPFVEKGPVRRPVGFGGDVVGS